jgi:hypothetical protein
MNISGLFSKGVTDKDNKLIQEYTNKLTEKEKIEFNKILKDLTDMEFKVTHNAIRLTLKLLDETGIKTFPYIQKEARKGYSIGDGTYAFSMYLLEGNYKTLNSYSKVKDLLVSKNKIISNIRDVHMLDLVIDVE